MNPMEMLINKDVITQSLVYSGNGGSGDGGKGNGKSSKKTSDKRMPYKILNICHMDVYSGKISCNAKRNYGQYSPDRLITDPLYDWEREYYRTKDFILERFINRFDYDHTPRTPYNEEEFKRKNFKVMQKYFRSSWGYDVRDQENEFLDKIEDILNELVRNMLFQVSQYHKNNRMISKDNLRKENFKNLNENYIDPYKRSKESNQRINESYKENQWYQKVKNEMEKEKKYVNNINNTSKSTSRKSINFRNQKIYDV